MKFSAKFIRVTPRMIFMIALSTLLSFSSCRYLPQIFNWAEADINAPANYLLATQLGHPEAAAKLITLAEQTHNLHWLHLLADMQVANAQYALGLLSDNKSVRSRMLHNAAAQDHVEALYLLGQNSYNSETRTHFLTRAAEQEHVPSQRALYQWYWMQEDFEQAMPWLNKVAQTHGDSALLLARYHWKHGERQIAKQWFAQAAQLGEADAKTYQKLIKRYWGKKPKKRPLQFRDKNDLYSAIYPSLPAQCAIEMQFIATSLESIKQASEFAQRFKKDQQLKSLGMCVKPILWLDPKHLQCQNFANNNYRITCDVEYLSKVFSPGDFTHLVIFAEQGKANVNNGIMFVDLADQYSVFVHELAHFAGFVDEYPLSERLAEQICDDTAIHPNVYIQKPRYETKGEGKLAELKPVFDPTDVDLRYWQKFSNNLAITKARTCKNHPNQAYKFVGSMTFMEFHDQTRIPTLYLDIWRARLKAPYLLVPASLNIAHALEDAGDFDQADVWRNHFIAFRSGSLHQ